MFGPFKKVSSNEQQMLTKLALELIEQIDQLESNHEFFFAMSQSQRDGIRKYNAAAMQCLKYGKSWDGSDNMQRVMWNAFYKQLSAASNLMKETLNIIEQNS